MAIAQPRIAITSGEPAGIGPDICLDILEMNLSVPMVVIGDIHVLKSRAKLLGKHIVFRDYHAGVAPQKNVLDVLSLTTAVPVTPGCLNIANASYVLSLLDKACVGIEEGEFVGMVTAPVHKGIINDAGIRFSGHTEYLAAKSHTKQVVMMLVGGGLRVALATTHIPIRKVADAITSELLLSVLRVVNHDLKRKFGFDQPRIYVSGLNPHAGEQGYLGEEEIKIIEPVLRQLQDEGMHVFGPFPADTIFQPFMLERADVVLAMYHDQGLPVLKHASFGHGVNVTLGLPFIRTSVDHGTALSLAGTGKAQSGSLKEAVFCAYQMWQAQQKYN